MRSNRIPTSWTHRAMTLSETLVIGAVLAVVLLVAALATSHVRGVLKRQQARALLATLDEALSAYHRVTGQWPAVDDAAEAGPADPHSSPAAEMFRVSRIVSDRMMTTLSRVADSRQILEDVPEVLRVDQIPAAEPDGTDEWWGVRDPWGTRLACFTASSDRQEARELVAANGGKPVFVSAGPDGDFGAFDVAAQADNLFLEPSPGPVSRPAETAPAG